MYKKLITEIKHRISELENERLLDRSKKAILIKENKRFLARCQQLQSDSVVQDDEPFYCVSSGALVHRNPCEKWCGDENCKTLCAVPENKETTKY